MKLTRLISTLFMCSWMLGAQVWYYRQFVGILRGLFNTILNAK